MTFSDAGISNRHHFAGKVSKQIVDMPMGTKCAPVLVYIFLCSYETEFIPSLLSVRKQSESQFNFTYMYIDDVLSLNNQYLENNLDQICPFEYMTESNTSASYLDLQLSIGMEGHLYMFIYDKCDDFTFNITNFPFLSSNIPSSPPYSVLISQLIRYVRACSSYEYFILWDRRFTYKLLKQRNDTS